MYAIWISFRYKLLRPDVSAISAQITLAFARGLVFLDIGTHIWRELNMMSYKLCGATSNEV